MIIKNSGIRKREITFSVLIISPIIYFWSGPILEGYGINLATTYFQFFPEMAGRPLALFPEYLASEIGGNSKTGYFFIGMLFLCAKAVIVYLITRGKTRLEFLILFTIFSFLPPWFGFINERYFAAHLALIFSILSLYFTHYFKSAPLAIIFGFLSGIAYPPIVFASIYTSLVTLVIYRRGKSFKEILLPQIGTVLFLAYYMFIKLEIENSYEAQSAGKFTISNILNLLNTTFFDNHYKGALLAMLVFLVIYLTGNQNTRGSAWAVFILCTIPFSALGYAGSSLHVNDPDRVLYPVAASLLLLIISLFALEGRGNFSFHKGKLNYFLAMITLAFFLTTLLVQLAQWNQYFKLNQELVTTITTKLKSEKVDKLLIIDRTNFFGDVYTLLNSADILSLALKPDIEINKTVICNSHLKESSTFAFKYPIPGAEKCANVALTEFDKVLMITNINPLKVATLYPKNQLKADEYLE